MPPKSARAASAKAPAKGSPASSVAPDTKTVPAAKNLKTFPFAQYASVLAVHLALVGFSALYLPQTTRLFAPLAAARETDRPQSEFIDALTADPSSTLGWTSAGLVLVELWWASWVRTWSFEQTVEGSEVEVKLKRARFDGLRFTRLRDAIAFTLCAALAAHVVLVVFGAPVATHILQTGLLALVIAILTAFTPAFVLGFPWLTSDTPSLVNRVTWTRLFVERSPRNAIERVMVYPAVGTFIGSWLGAFPIALDWDRPWQAWPRTPFFGAIGGYIVGALYAFASNTDKWLVTEHLWSRPG